MINKYIFGTVPLGRLQISLPVLISACRKWEMIQLMEMGLLASLLRMDPKRLPSFMKAALDSFPIASIYTSTDGLVTFRNTFDQGSNHFGIDINFIYSPNAIEINRRLNDGSRLHVIFP
ncbi:hypothetical protein FEM48_Zijuj05G0189300 [Ziziphus jujuba var. spinosa]|uniref:Uncharacterized protein n=1 Tax=Ziziphus jujuba var. spinosa TaxID=714518 RepID=A0A978VGJ9_ZIZJJ|nr:hypothetical protein FEM48_Zijuj05G0189300 [Ziziphus jujuba var. spinosa]